MACNKAYCAKWYIDNKERAAADQKKRKVANHEKEKARSAKYRANHLAKAKAYNTQWQKDNAQAVNAKNAKWRAENHEKMKQWIAEWEAKHPDAKRIRCQNRRAKQRENGGTLSKGLVKELFRLQQGKCACCYKPLGSKFHLDHKMPVALGGAHQDWNMQLLCPTCNLSKHAKHPIDFMQSRGFLL